MGCAGLFHLWGGGLFRVFAWAVLGCSYRA
jgi:hypothetical protein